MSSTPVSSSDPRKPRLRLVPRSLAHHVQQVLTDGGYTRRQASIWAPYLAAHRPHDRNVSLLDYVDMWHLHVHEPADALVWIQALGPVGYWSVERWERAGWGAEDTLALHRACRWTSDPFELSCPPGVTTPTAWRDSGIPCEWAIRYAMAGCNWAEARKFEADRREGVDHTDQLLLLAAHRQD